MAHEINWKLLSETAWSVRGRAVLAPSGKTKVGCAAVDAEGVIGLGCNLQHVFRCDIHAEVGALSSMVAMGGSRAIAVLVVAEREKFVPCGHCMDWIMELGGPDCIVAFQPKRDAEIVKYKASEVMPHYPS